MKPAYTLDQVRSILRRHFGASWESAYDMGKTEMALWLVDRLKMSEQTTSRAVQEMERQGMLRFENANPTGDPGVGVWSVEEARIPQQEVRIPQQAGQT